MILHCVMCNFQDGVTADEQLAVFNDLANFSADLEGVADFKFGPNRDFEDKSQDYNSGFVIRFEDQASLKAYADHPTHKELGARLCGLCKNGADGIIVFDLEV